VGFVARTEERRVEYRALVESTGRKRPHGRLRRRWEDIAVNCTTISVQHRRF
jgi:hypothetical protein